MSQQDYTRSNHNRGSDASHPPRGDGSRRRRRPRPAFNALTYVLFVIAVSVILACVGWVAANDVLALNKDPLTATIVIDDDDHLRSGVHSA